jgi:hypothetical protein
MKTVTFASTDRIDALEPYVDRVLQAIGIAQAWVSNESQISDFGLSDEELARAAKELGLPVQRGDYLWKVARALAERDCLQ